MSFKIVLLSQTVLIVGIGGAGSEASKLCAALGMRVLGSDPRVTAPPHGMAELFTPDQLEDRQGEADFVIVTTPETPETLGLFNAQRFARMKRGTNMYAALNAVTSELISFDPVRCKRPADST